MKVLFNGFGLGFGFGLKMMVDKGCIMSGNELLRLHKPTSKRTPFGQFGYIKARVFLGSIYFQVLLISRRII